MTENVLSILIAIFLYNSNKERPQTESSVFSDVAAGMEFPVISAIAELE